MKGKELPSVLERRDRLVFSRYKKACQDNKATLEGKPEKCVLCENRSDYLMFLAPKRGERSWTFLCKIHFQTQYPPSNVIGALYYSVGFTKLEDVYRSIEGKKKESDGS